MKKKLQSLFLKFIFLLAVIPIFAQDNWDLFPLNQRSYIQIEDELFVHYNDSTETLPYQKRLHHFGIKYYQMPLDTCQYEFLTSQEVFDYPPLLFPQNDTLFSQKKYFYKIIEQDTLIFYHQKKPGFFWFIPSSTEDSIKITVRNIEPEIINGYTDSVKTYSLEVWSEGQVVEHPFNSFDLRLGKNLGLLNWISFEDLYYLNGLFHARTLFGFEKNGEKYGFTAAFSDYIHPEVGEVYKYSIFSLLALDYGPGNSTKIFERDSIVKIWENENWLYTEVLRDISKTIQYNFTEEIIYEFGQKDTLWYPKSLEKYFQYPPNLPFIEVYESNQYETALDLKIRNLKVNPNTYISDESGNNWGYILNFDDCHLTLSEYYEQRNVGYNTRNGLAFQNHTIFYSSHEGYFSKSLTGYKTADGITFGDVGIISSTKNPNIQALPIRLFPNPTKDYLYIELPKNQKHKRFFVEIYDKLGMLIKTQKWQMGSPIEVINLPTGIYQIFIIGTHFQGKARFVKTH